MFEWAIKQAHADSLILLQDITGGKLLLQAAKSNPQACRLFKLALGMNFRAMAPAQKLRVRRNIMHQPVHVSGRI